MRNLLLTTAALAAFGTVAFAQDATSGMFRPAADAMELRASNFIGMRIYATETAVDATEYDGMQQGWNDIGEVNDVILSRDGSVEAVLVDIGGFLGMGERQVAVSMDAIKFVSDSSTGDAPDDFFLVMSAARADFEGAPDYMMGAGGAATGDAAGQAADPAMAADPAATTDAADPAATTEAENQAAGTAATTEAADPAAATDPAAPADTATSGTAREPLTRDGYMAADAEYLTAEKLTGASVYDANDEVIGEVGALVLSDTGQVTQAVIDVGGFLGMGEKPVALELTDIDILRNEAGDDVRVYLTKTKEELEAMPDFAG